MANKLILTFLVSLVLLSPAAHGWTLKKVEGQIYKLIKGKKKTLKRGVRLKEGDVLFTGKKSKALLVEGESKIWMGSLTRIQLQAPDSEQERVSWIAVLYGKMRAKISKPEAKKYKYRVRSATAGVRGTEFFIDADEKGGFLCTLEGEVEVQSQNKKLSVQSGKGVLISANKPAKVGETSQYLMDQWVVETSFSDATQVASIPDMYSQVQKLRPLGKSNKWFAGTSGTLYWCDNHNIGFDKSADPQSCIRGYFSPRFEYGVDSKWALEAFVSLVSFDHQTIIDNVPSFTGNVAQSVGVSEFSYSLRGDKADYKVGIFKVNWAEGVLLSEGAWTQEPQRLAGIQLKFEELWGSFELLATKGVETDKKLDGLSHIDFLGINTRWFKDTLDLYLLYANFGKMKVGTNLYTHGHKLVNLGAYYNQKYSTSDFKGSVILQRHTRHMNPKSNDHSGVDSGLADIEYGKYFKGQKNYRVSLRGLVASENFMPILDDYYQLGISGTPSSRVNLIQVRFKGELAWNESQVFSLEWIHNTQNRAGGFLNHGSASKDYSFLGSEVDILWNYKWKSGHMFRLGAYVFSPANISVNKDSIFGTIARYEFSL